MLTVLVHYLELPEWGDGCNDGLHVVELFAGVARISRLASWVGLKARAYDLTYLPLRKPYGRKRGFIRRKPMDINGSAGFA